MPLDYILYHSRALIPDEPGAHNKILNACKRNNYQSNITGFLHREEGFFLQYLEGESEVLDLLLDTIAKDPRHTDVTIVLREKLCARRLPDWQMGFVDADQLALVDLVGTVDGKIDIKSADPNELIDFVIENADSLTGMVLAS